MSSSSSWVVVENPPADKCTKEGVSKSTESVAEPAAKIKVTHEVLLPGRWTEAAEERALDLEVVVRVQVVKKTEAPAVPQASSPPVPTPPQALQNVRGPSGPPFVEQPKHYLLYSNPERPWAVGLWSGPSARTWRTCVGRGCTYSATLWRHHCHQPPSTSDHRLL